LENRIEGWDAILGLIKAHQCKQLCTALSFDFSVLKQIKEPVLYFKLSLIVGLYQLLQRFLGFFPLAIWNFYLFSPYEAVEFVRMEIELFIIDIGCIIVWLA